MHLKCTIIHTIKYIHSFIHTTTRRKYCNRKEVLQQEYSQPTILHSRHFGWIVKPLTYPCPVMMVEDLFQTGQTLLNPSLLLRLVPPLKHVLGPHFLNVLVHLKFGLVTENVVSLCCESNDNHQYYFHWLSNRLTARLESWITV